MDVIDGETYTIPGCVIQMLRIVPLENFRLILAVDDSTVESTASCCQNLITV